MWRHNRCHPWSERQGGELSKTKMQDTEILSQKEQHRAFHTRTRGCIRKQRIRTDRSKELFLRQRKPIGANTRTQLLLPHCAPGPEKDVGEGDSACGLRTEPHLLSRVRETVVEAHSSKSISMLSPFLTKLSLYKGGVCRRRQCTDTSGHTLYSKV